MIVSAASLLNRYFALRKLTELRQHGMDAISIPDLTDLYTRMDYHYLQLLLKHSLRFFDFSSLFIRSIILEVTSIRIISREI